MKDLLQSIIRNNKFGFLVVTIALPLGYLSFNHTNYEGSYVYKDKIVVTEGLFFGCVGEIKDFVDGKYYKVDLLSCPNDETMFLAGKYFLAKDLKRLTKE